MSSQASSCTRLALGGSGGRSTGITPIKSSTRVPTTWNNARHGWNGKQEAARGSRRAAAAAYGGVSFSASRSNRFLRGNHQLVLGGAVVSARVKVKAARAGGVVGRCTSQSAGWLLKAPPRFNARNRSHEDPAVSSAAFIWEPAVHPYNKADDDPGALIAPLPPHFDLDTSILLAVGLPWRGKLTSARPRVEIARVSSFQLLETTVLSSSLGFKLTQPVPGSVPLHRGLRVRGVHEPVGRPARHRRVW